jgi:copper(I)-binding protein
VTSPGRATRVGVGVAAAVLLLVLGACGSREATSVRPADLVVSDVRIPAPAGPSAALYLTVANRAGAADRLEAVHTPVAGMTMLHRTVQEGDRMSMEPVSGGLPVPAGGRLVLAPGGAHVMLMELQRKLAVGDHVPVTLVFQRAGEVDIQAQVVSYADVESPGPARNEGGR